MSEEGSVRDRIAGLFLAALKLDVPSPDTDLFEAGVLDSMAFVELLLNLEREFGLKVAVEDLELENFRSIAKIADFVMARDDGARPFPK
jgi:D-alanine--poly(phosphoribitol) ligase subunit 2